MKRCELCKFPARVHCESDQASLCWDCDSKVHSANFLVARHSRSPLCRACQSPTPWLASGPKLCTTVSVCESCVRAGDGIKGGGAFKESEDINVDEIDDGDEFEVDDGKDSENDDEEEQEEEGDLIDCNEEGENQVVPCYSTPPPPDTSFSSSEESSSGCCDGDTDLNAHSSLKRKRKDFSDLPCQEDLSPTTRRENSTAMDFNIGIECYANSVRPSKDRRTEPASNRPVQEESIQSLNPSGYLR